MTAVLNLPGGHVAEHDRDVIPISSWTPVRDPKWSFTDAEGHEHHYDGAWATNTRWIETAPAGFDADGEEYNAEGDYHCSVCGEVIVPGTWVDPFPTYITTGETYRWDGRECTRDEWERLVLAAVEEMRG